MKHKLAEMMGLDLFLSQISRDEYLKIQDQIGKRKALHLPLMSWDMYMDGYHNRSYQSERSTDLKTVLSFANTYQWQNDIVRDFKENDYDALIITDKDQNIIWVSNGFTKMTGYSKEYAINKTPRFLQGEKTSLKTKQRIKSKLAADLPFKDIIVNHRKDKTPYACEVKIIPLYGNTTTHYIAFEKEVI